MSRLTRFSPMLFILIALANAPTLARAADEAPPEVRPVFDLMYDVGIVASEKSAHVEIRLGAGTKVVEWIRFKFDPQRHRAIEADGELREIPNGLEWLPPASGGSLRYVFSINHLRNDNAYDSRCAKSWAIFRGEDLVPSMRVRTVPISRARARMRIRLPEKWTASLPYRRLRSGDYTLDDRRMRVGRPSGWFAFGKLGIVRETIQDSRVTIAGPANQGVRRMDILALLTWTLPSLAEVFGQLPERLQIVVAGDPMWRGGLSGPGSVYLHVDRPLIDQDKTSPLLHELVHALMHARSGHGGDWIVEGLAEYYSIALLRRSGTVSASRYETSIDDIVKRGANSGDLFAESVDPATRGRAVGVLIQIDAEIRTATGGARSLDDVVRRLTEIDESITTQSFKDVVIEIAGGNHEKTFDQIIPKATPANPK